jgi:3-methyladenine DNA glycosylase AlkD
MKSKLASEIIIRLDEVLIPHANPEVAPFMSKYMKNKFDYLGINTPLRRELIKSFLLEIKSMDKKIVFEVANLLWQKREREYQYIAMEALLSKLKQFEKGDIAFFEQIIIQKSWWDTIDVISPKLAGAYFKMYPEDIIPTIQSWIISDNIWLQRSAILFQLKYKSETDTVLLSQIIHRLNGGKEFFINKAIGWILREYGKTDSQWVKNFCRDNELSNLTRKEALRRMVNG